VTPKDRLKGDQDGPLILIAVASIAALPNRAPMTRPWARGNDRVHNQLDRPVPVAPSVDLMKSSGTSDLSEYAGDLEEAADAREMVWRLMRHLPSHLHDDVTILALRRMGVDSCSRLTDMG
jgi:hypothetical protein